jgi:YVTN family beta-propeller protein
LDLGTLSDDRAELPLAAKASLGLGARGEGEMISRNEALIIGTILLSLLVPAFAQTVVTTITVGTHPTGVGVNVRNNQIYVATSGDNTVSVIDGSTNQVTAAIPGIIFSEQVAINPTTNHIYAGEFETSNIAAIAAGTQQVSQIQVTTQPGPTSSQSVVVNSKTNRVYVCSNNQIVVIDGSTNKVVTNIPVNLCDFALGVDNVRNLIYAGTLDRTLAVIDGSTNQVVNTFNLNVGLGLPVSVAVDTLNNRVAIAASSANGMIEVIDGSTGAEIGEVSGLSSPNTVVFTPGGKLMLITEGGANNLRFASAQTFKVKATVAVGQLPIGLAINPVTNLAYVANFTDDTVSVVSLP